MTDPAPSQSIRVTGGRAGVPLARRVATLAASVRPYRLLVGWAVGWAFVGAVVGLGIVFTRGATGFLPVLRQSVLFAEVVGFTALTSARVVFPLYSRLPAAARFALQVLTLLSGTLFGSVAILATQPLFSLASPRTVAVIVFMNAAFAVVVGIALHTYDSMKRQIEESYRVLREKEAMEREMAIARDVQRELLPRAAPRVRGLDLAGACVPAIGVGGDLYDFLPFSDESIGLVIADVSGKGIPAALLMAGLQASVRSIALPGVAPAEVNRRLNEMLLRSTSDARYATMFFARYDGRSRVLTYSNAGHYPPLRIGGNGASRLLEGGFPIGLLDGAHYREEKRAMTPGDLLVLYTDGIIESPGENDEEFGERRLVEALGRHRSSDLEEMVRLVIDDVRAWSRGRPQHDDVTLVLGRIT